MQNVISIKRNVKSVNQQFSWLYLLFTGLFSFLFYTGEFGLSVTIFSVGYSLVQIVKTPKRHRVWLWWVALLAMNIASVGILRFENTGSYLAFILALIFHSGTILKNEGVSVLTSFIHFFKSFGQGMGMLWVHITKRSNAKSDEQSKNNTKRYAIALIAAMTLLLFIYIYQFISPELSELIESINFDFISVQWIIVFVFSFLMLYGVFHQFFNAKLSIWERRLKAFVSKQRTDGFESYFSFRQEKMLSVSVLIVLNLMVALILFFEFKRYFTNGVFVIQDMIYTTEVHSSIRLLILSIVLAVIAISLSLRGRLNFKDKTTVKSLAILWMVLNIGLVLVAGIKNLEYIQEFGLTYKRMGVFIYLSLCIIGLVFTILKIIFNQTFAYLFKTVSFVFFIYFIGSTQVNWDKIIVDYNLNEERFVFDEMDFDYMIPNLGLDAQVEMHQFLIEKDPESRFVRLLEFEKEYQLFWDNSHWRSFSFARLNYENHFFSNQASPSQDENRRR